MTPTVAHLNLRKNRVTLQLLKEADIHCICRVNAYLRSMYNFGLYSKEGLPNRDKRLVCRSAAILFTHRPRHGSPVSLQLALYSP